MPDLQCCMLIVALLLLLSPLRSDFRAGCLQQCGYRPPCSLLPSLLLLEGMAPLSVLCLSGFAFRVYALLVCLFASMPPSQSGHCHSRKHPNLPALLDNPSLSSAHEALTAKSWLPKVLVHAQQQSKRLRERRHCGVASGRCTRTIAAAAMAVLSCRGGM
jgi:hypothetical protein